MFRRALHTRESHRQFRIRCKFLVQLDKISNKKDMIGELSIYLRIGVIERATRKRVLTGCKLRGRRRRKDKNPNQKNQSLPQIEKLFDIVGNLRQSIQSCVCALRKSLNHKRHHTRTRKEDHDRLVVKLH